VGENLKISIALVVAAGAALLGFAALTGGDEPDAPKSDRERRELLVRPDSQRLNDGPDATFVEFLDFECEACGALYPTIEELRDTYGDRVSFVVRYLPLHTSSVNAARAAEAGAAQGEFEAMYDLLFQPQDQWGHQDSPEEPRFFDYAEELGLDMDRFRADYDDPEARARIEQDEADARALGITGTPTMFMDGERLQPKTVDDLTAAFDDAVGS
jgi:protein-disulfide isomerase